MKIPASVRALFGELSPRYEKLKTYVDALFESKIERRWHYESRLKTEESFALKLETGRELNPGKPEDFFACTVVVENQTKIRDAEDLAFKLFKLVQRRPERNDTTPLQPHSFDFDDLRLYVTWVDDKTQKPTGLDGLLFELQIKTFLQHAWSVATHDLVYKTDDVNWGTSRIAYQVKASLENAELSISEARRLTDASMLKKTDKTSFELLNTIREIQKRWAKEQLPDDLRRLAQSIGDIAWLLQIRLDDVWKDVDAATASGSGTKTLNLSPHGAVLSALLEKRGPHVFDPLANARKRKIFVPLEINLPHLAGNVMGHIIRPPDGIA